MYELERRIAESHVSRTDSVDVHKANNPWNLREFAAKAPGLDWAAYFEAAGLSGQPMIMVWHPGAVTGIAALAGKEPLDVWKDYLTYHAVDRASPLLPAAFAEERFRFYGTALGGVQKQRDRWKRPVSATSASLGDAVGRLYVEKHFSAEDKAQADEMVRNIVAAFERRIEKLEWMSPATKEKALAKVGTLYVGMGYPDKWIDYSGLEIRRDDALGNAQRAELFTYRRSLAKLGQPVDRKEWCMTPQTANAVNLPLQNAMNFPAAILNPPFYYPGGDPIRNYGAMGSVIGHEISHSFDDQGAQFDAQGRLANWWTKEDLAHFNAAAERLVAQYNAYEPLPGVHLNGKLTLSENIADVAGVSAAYDGYKIAYAGKPLPGSRRLHGRPALLHRLRSGLARQGEARGAAHLAHDGQPRPGRVPRRHGAKPRRLVRRFRSAAGHEAVPRSGGAGPRLVIPPDPEAEDENEGAAVPRQPLPSLRGASALHPHRAFGLHSLPDPEALPSAARAGVRRLRADRARGFRLTCSEGQAICYDR